MSKDLERKQTPQDAMLAAFQEDMAQIVPYLQSLLPWKGAVERFVKMTRMAVMRNPDLLKCNRKSLFLSLLWCAEKSLEPGVEDGVWLIPFKGVVQPITAYKGLIKRAIDTESVKDVQPYAIYQNDEFEYTLGTDPQIVHKPPKIGLERGDLIGAYLVVTMPDGDKRFSPPLDKASIEKARNAGAAWKAKPGTGPWHDWTEAMFLKTAVKAGLKYVRLKAPMQDLITDDGRIDAGETVATLLSQAGAAMPEALQGEDEPEPTKPEPLDTSQFNDFLAAKMLHPDRVARVSERLKEIAEVWTQNYKKPFTEDQVKVEAGKKFEEFWAGYVEWETEKYPPQGNKAPEPEPGNEPPETAGAGEGWGDFAPRRKAAFNVLMQKGVPPTTSGITREEDITEENIAQVEELGKTYEPPRKGKK